MLEGAILGVLRAVLGLAALVAIAVQMAWTLSPGKLSILNYSSYFVILAGFLAAVALITHASLNLRGGSDPFLSNLRGATTLFMVAVLIGTLSSGGQLEPGVFAWAAVILHWVLPIALITDWFAAPSAESLGWHHAIQWLIFPLAWVIYTLLHGAFTGWYPYRHIDPSSVGAWQVAIYLILSAIVLAVVIFLQVRLPRLYFKSKAAVSQPVTAAAPPPPVPPPLYTAPTTAKPSKSKRKNSKK